MSAAKNDPLDLPLRTLLERLLATQPGDTGWVNIRTEQWPWRQLVAAAERGECSVCRVGRKLLMRREDLDGWLAKHQIPTRAKKNPEDGLGVDGDDNHIKQLLEDAGYRRKRR